MFKNSPNLTTIADGVYIYKNFIDKDVVSNINKIIENKLEELKSIDFESKIDWYQDKIVGEIDELFPIWEQISEFLLPTHVMHPMLQVSVMRPGEGGMFVHEDSPGEGNHDQLTNYDTWTTCTVLDYGVIAYFGEFSGGEVFYPELDIEISPQPGDLVIHGATPRWKHGVKEVSTGIRYAFANFSLPYHKNPNTFYNYKTEEYHNQLNNLGLKSWIAPLKPNIREYAPLPDKV
jgi:hypothetical protein